MTTITYLPEHLQQRLRAELKPGESLVWSSQPNADQFMKSGFLLWLFFIPWTVISLIWIASALNFQLPQFNGGQNLFPLLGIPFVLIGIGGLCTPIWRKRHARSIIYAITNQRAITIEGVKSFTVKSYSPSDISMLERHEGPDGLGSLILKSESYRDSDGIQQTTQYGFFAIENVRAVENFVQNLIRTNHSQLGN